MKRAWIVYQDIDDFNDDIKTVKFEEPDDCCGFYYKIIPIVYTELLN